jgi:ssDNA-binding Zn-finger/Zn-ribbon topoisomerase 1
LPDFGFQGHPPGQFSRRFMTIRTEHFCTDCRFHLAQAPPPAGRQATTPGDQEKLTMSFDLFMNDTCPKCRKPLKPAAVEQHPSRSDLAVHKFECANCGAVQTKTLFRKQGRPQPVELAV